MSLTKEIINAIGRRQVLRNHTPVCPNVSVMFNWEVDLFSVNKAGYTYEFEVKISRQDFLKDKNKKKWAQMGWLKPQKTPNYFCYVCPDGMIDVNEIPAFAGLYYYSSGEIVEVRKPTIRHDVIKDFSEINMKIARMYSQRQYLNGHTLITHLNGEIKKRNDAREAERKENREKFMAFVKEKREKLKQ